MSPNRFLSFVFISLIGFLFCADVHAGEKIIKLKDGSVLKGEVVSFANGYYFLKTSHLGEVQISDDDILSIQAPQAAQAARQRQAAESSAGKNLGGGISINDPNLMNQINQMQSSLLSDPAAIMQIQSIFEDEEMMKLLSDPKLMEDIQSMNIQEIQNNESFQKLMQNPSMQKLIQDVEGTYGRPQIQETP